MPPRHMLPYLSTSACVCVLCTCVGVVPPLNARVRMNYNARASVFVSLFAYSLLSCEWQLRVRVRVHLSMVRTSYLSCARLCAWACVRRECAHACVCLRPCVSASRALSVPVSSGPPLCFFLFSPLHLRGCAHVGAHLAAHDATHAFFSTNVLLPICVNVPHLCV